MDILISCPGTVGLSMDTRLSAFCNVGAVARKAYELGLKAPYSSFISEQIRFTEDLRTDG